MWNDLHTKFWEWNAPQHNTEPLGISLLEFSKFENIAFFGSYEHKINSGISLFKKANKK